MDRARGELEAVRVSDPRFDKRRRKARVRHALKSEQVEGNSLTFEEAFVLAKDPPARKLGPVRNQLDLLREPIACWVGRKFASLQRSPGNKSIDLLSLGPSGG